MRHFLPNRIVPLALTLLLSACLSTAEEKTLSFEQARENFALEMAAKHGFDRSQTLSLMRQANYQPSIIEAMTRPAEGLPWHRYRKIFVTPSRAALGLAFWNEHQATLDRAAAQFGVPAEIIVAIIGVETRYGRHTGNHSVLDALSTLAFGYPRRAAFFKKQLEHYLLLLDEESIDPMTTKGSYAGAIGIPQFIPSSYRSYAVDFDGDEVRDLANSPADAIGSVANYLHRHKWHPGELIATVATGAEQTGERFELNKMKPAIAFSKLTDAGISTDHAIAPETQATLLRLESKTGSEYWLGLHNFYVITRYNHSNLYAMAVFQLSQKILALRESSLTTASHD